MLNHIWVKIFIALVKILWLNLARHHAEFTFEWLSLSCLTLGVFRDIKSSNLLMKSEEGNCVIGDLGLALQLIPTNDPKDVSNYGQVSHTQSISCDLVMWSCHVIQQCGTIRYMSPEALEARVNLLDIQSFKQIDIYAFSLVMWEVLSRCCVLDRKSHDNHMTGVIFSSGTVIVFLLSKF